MESHQWNCMKVGTWTQINGCKTYNPMINLVLHAWGDWCVILLLSNEVPNKTPRQPFQIPVHTAWRELRRVELAVMRITGHLKCENMLGTSIHCILNLPWFIFFLLLFHLFSLHILLHVSFHLPLLHIVPHCVHRSLILLWKFFSHWKHADTVDTEYQVDSEEQYEQFLPILFLLFNPFYTFKLEKVGLDCMHLLTLLRGN
jgi:hypothetical protein